MFLMDLANPFPSPGLLLHFQSSVLITEVTTRDTQVSYFTLGLYTPITVLAFLPPQTLARP